MRKKEKMLIVYSYSCSFFLMFVFHCNEFLPQLSFVIFKVSEQRQIVQSRLNHHVGKCSTAAGNCAGVENCGKMFFLFSIGCFDQLK